jgi:hypothetical protein
MALELSNKTWRLALSDGTTRRQVTVPSADLLKLAKKWQSIEHHALRSARPGKLYIS